MIVQSLPFPILLTLLRLFCGSLIVPPLAYLVVPYNNLLANSIVAFLFLFFVITDLVDGFLARKNKQVSSLGAFLDPIADKFLIVSTTITLLSINKISVIFVFILIGRELCVMSLRQLALEHHQQLKVSLIGKFKMLMQSIYLFFLIITPYYDQPYSQAPYFKLLQYILLIVTGAITIISGALYIKNFLRLIPLESLCDWKVDSDDN